MDLAKQHIEATGLDGDYMNAWVGLDAAFRLLSRGSEIYRDKELLVETYEQYLRRKYADVFDEKMGYAKPEAIAAMDALCAEFNALPLEERISTIWTFDARVREVLAGNKKSAG